MSESERLIAAFLDNALSDSDRNALNVWLKADQANVRRLADTALFEQQIHVATHAGAEWVAASTFQDADSTRPSRDARSFRRFPIAAAAAGLVFGILSATVTWVYAAPRAMTTALRVDALADGSFESRTGRLPSGFPKSTGAWSGDESEIVDATAITLKVGRRMLRFVRAEADATMPNNPAESCDVFQIVDLRPLKGRFADGSSLLELSAEFLDMRSDSGTPIRFGCHLYLFEGPIDNLHRLWPLNLNDSVGSGVAQFISTGGSANAEWRRVSAQCVLPPNADYVVIQLAAGRDIVHRKPAPELGAQYANDVNLTLKTLPVLPVRTARK